MHPDRAETQELSTALVTAIAKATRTCIITIDPGGIITSWSPAVERFLGYTADEVVGRPWREFLTLDLQADAIDIERQLRVAQPVGDRVLTFRTDRGGARDLVLTATPITHDSEVSGAVLVLRTGGEDAETLRRAARRLAAIVETSDDAIISKDLDGIVLTWNRAAELMFGYTPIEMIGHSIRRIIPTERQSEEDEVLARIRRGDRVDHFETVRLRKDGTLVPVSLTVSPIVDADGTIIGASKIARDIRDRKRLDAIVESSDDAIVSKTLDGIVTSWNWAAEKMFGFTAEEMVGQSIRRIIPADRQYEEDDVLARVRRGEKLDHFETVRQRKDGTPVFISLTVSPIRDDRGAVVGASKIARDISERKRGEEERARLLAIAERNASLAEKLNRVGALVASTLDRDAVVQAVTDAATELTTAQFGAFFYNVIDERGEAYTLYTISGVPREAFANFPMPRNTPMFEPTFRGTAVVRSDDITQDPRYGRNPPFYGQPAGHLPVRSYLAVPVRSNTGVVLGGIFFGHPAVGQFTQEHESIAVGIAAWASVALENARLYRSLQDANRLKDEFLATLSHELRTPLNAILGYARMLRSGMLSGARQGRALDTIDRNAESLTQIVEDVLDVSRIIAGKMRLNVQEVDVSAVVQQAVEAIQPSAELKGIAVHSELDRSAGPVAGDPERIQQITWNLLSNAVKFTDRGGRIDVRVARTAPNVTIVVSDTGVGIAPEFLPYIFERFRQGDASTTRVHGGLGLGLSIVRQLVEMHGGSITGASEGVNRGATFTVALPLIGMKPEAPPVHMYSPQTELPVRLADLTGIHVLAVDDEEDAVAMVRDILETAGATVTTARSVDEAMAELGTTVPDVIVADLAMPRVDGFALIARVRSSRDDRVRTIPAAALTAFARSDDRTRVLDAGFQMHLAKPINPAELVQSVRALSQTRK